MTASCGRPGAGLDALRAAVAEVRSAERARTARADRLAPPGAAFATRTAGRGGASARAAGSTVGSPASAPAPASVAVPAPAPAPDDALPAADLPAPVGDAALGLALVQRAQQGDAEAFGELYDRYVDLVHRYIAYRVGSRQLAEDLTSETFLRALKRIGTFSWQGRDVGAWFVTIARNLVADHYKSSRYRLELTTDDVGESGGAQLVTDGPEGEVLDGLRDEVLLRAVRQLGAEQQECIALRFLQGLSVSETAQVMGKNDQSVKALQYRAVKALARLLPEGMEL